MLTVINADGSCYKEFSGKVKPSLLTEQAIEIIDNGTRAVDKDSSTLPCNEAVENPFPISLDSTCQVFWQAGKFKGNGQYPINKHLVDSVIWHSDKNNPCSIYFDVMIRKNYSSIKCMENEFRLMNSHEWHDLKINYSLTKKFRWFYTYYTYCETYPKIKQHFIVPLEQYMSKDEIGFWCTGKPDLLKGMNGVEIHDFTNDLDKKFEDWYTYNFWTMEYEYVNKNYRLLPRQPVSQHRFAELKDTIFESEVKYSSEGKDMNEILDRYFKTNAFSVLWNRKDSIMQKFEQNFGLQMQLPLFFQKINYRLLMPGKVVASNSAVSYGDTLVWQLSAYRMIPANYTISATSAKANIWAFIVTGIVVLIAIGSFIWRPKRRKV